MKNVIKLGIFCKEIEFVVSVDVDPLEKLPLDRFARAANFSFVVVTIFVLVPQT